MMRNFKLLAALLVLIAMLTSACGDNAAQSEKPSPAADIKTFTEAVLHEDEAALKRINMSKETLHQQISSAFKKSFAEATNGVDFTDEQLNRICETFINTLKKSNITTQDVSENDGKATVAVTLGVFEELNEEKLTSYLPADFAAQSSMDEAMNLIVQAIVDAVNDLQVTGESTFNVECEYNDEGKMWVPVDAESFGAKAMETMFKME